MSFLAVFHNCRHSSSRYLAVRETKLYENLSYVPHVALNYSIKNIRNDLCQIIHMKQITSVGSLMLAPIILPLSMVLLHLHVHACMCTCVSIPHYDEQLNEDTYCMRCFYLLNEQGKPPDCILCMRQQPLISFLSHPKDPLPELQRRDVVYKIPCATCSSSYIGQTGRKLSQRLDEHRRAVRQADFNSSALAEHDMLGHVTML